VSQPEQRLQDEVLATFDHSPDGRLGEIMQGVVRHLHQLVQELQLSPQEWLATIHFLTAVGQISSATRQEFILLSDTLGVSSLVEMINYAGAPGSTENTVLGPFYVPGSPARAYGDSIVVDHDPGERLTVSGVVTSLDGTPLAGATVDVWQTATSGHYAVQDRNQDPQNLRGLFTTDGQGRYRFQTVRPVVYSIPDDGPVGQMLASVGRHPFRAAHVHLIVSAPGHHPVTTHVFDGDSAYLDSDAVFGVRETLVRRFEPDGDGGRAATFDVVLTPVEGEPEAGG
jgi:catechol 1,2-dioxygenase